MANADCNTLNGIYGNEQIMDHLYRYGDMLERKGKMSASINYDFEACAMHRISSINICLLEIESKKPGVNDESDTYFNYLRWNRKAINGEFDNFLQHPCMEKHRETLNASYQLFDNCMKEFYRLTHADMSIINEHTHIYDMISSRRRQPRKALLLQAGRLFANFINILKSRYYDEDTTDIQFADIEMQAGVIIEKLSTEHPQEANKVKGVYEDFNNWTKRQDSLRMVHIESLEKAMNLAHARATKAKVQKRHAVFRSATNNWNLFEALFTWANASPMKCSVILAGGYCIGVLVGRGAACYYTKTFDSTKAPALLILTGEINGVIARSTDWSGRPRMQAILRRLLYWSLLAVRRKF